MIESSDAKLSFSLERTDGGRDYVVVAKQSGTKSLGDIAGRVARGSLVVIRVGTDAQIEAVLEVK